MQVRYLEQANNSANMQYRTADGISNWNHIYAVEICLELSGTDNISTPDAQYINCNGTSASYGNHMKMIFRNTYQVRSQGNA